VIVILNVRSPRVPQVVGVDCLRPLYTVSPKIELQVFTSAIYAVSIVVNLDFISFMPLGCMAETSFHH